jgi:hypothetical protein
VDGGGDGGGDIDDGDKGGIATEEKNKRIRDRHDRWKATATAPRPVEGDSDSARGRTQRHGPTVD